MAYFNREELKTALKYWYEHLEVNNQEQNEAVWCAINAIRYCIWHDSEYSDDYKSCKGCKYYSYFLNNINDLINNAPTIPQTIITEFKGCDNCELERPKGEWISQDYDDLKISDYRCNQCGHYQDDITNFCPNCGANMRGDIKGDYLRLFND